MAKRKTAEPRDAAPAGTSEGPDGRGLPGEAPPGVVSTASTRPADVSKEDRFANSSPADLFRLCFGSFSVEINPLDGCERVGTTPQPLTRNFGEVNCDHFFLHQRGADPEDLQPFLRMRAEHQWHGIALLRDITQHSVFQTLVYQPNPYLEQPGAAIFLPETPFEMVHQDGSNVCWQKPVVLAVWGAYYISQLRLAVDNGLIKGVFYYG